MSAIEISSNNDDLVEIFNDDENSEDIGIMFEDLDALNNTSQLNNSHDEN